MNTTQRFRYYLWTGTDFATSLVLQFNTVFAFTSLYVAPLLQDFCLKERVWKQGAVQSSRDLVPNLTRGMALRAFYTAIESFKIRAIDEAQQHGNRLHVQDRSPLPWRVPTIGEPITTLRPIEASFSGSEGLPHCCFEPGDVGIITTINIPAVRHVPENPSDLLAIADFEQPSTLSFEGIRQCSWQCHLYYHQIIALPSAS